jgi:hypothetical protein
MHGVIIYPVIDLRSSVVQCLVWFQPKDSVLGIYFKTPYTEGDSSLQAFG